MIKLLTKRKQSWARQFKPQYLQGTPLNPNISDAIRYKKHLDKLISKMTSETEKELKTLFKTEFAKEYFATDASISSQARIITNTLTEKFNEMFAKLSKPLAEKVVEDADKSSSVSLHSSLKEMSGGLSLQTTSMPPVLTEALNASVTENVGLIKSIPAQYLQGVQGAVMRSITTGNGLQDLIPYLQTHKEITYRRAKNIAYDQTRKAYNTINRERMKNLGMKEFKWLHSGGSTHPRKDHIEMSGNIYSLDNPPIIGRMYGSEVRGFPGDLPNCRCRISVIMRFKE